MSPITPWLKIPGARCSQAMVPMRDGVRLNTFAYLPDDGAAAYPVIMQRSPYGITSPEGKDVTNPTRGWNPDPKFPLAGALLRGWSDMVRRGYAVVLQDCRGRHGSEGEDTVYGDDAHDGYDTLEWIAQQPWSNQRVGIAGSSAAATTTYAAVSQNHPSVKAFFAQVGGASIYNDVVYEGQSIELERLWLWVAENIPGLSRTHRERVQKRRGLTEAEFDHLADEAAARFQRLTKAAEAAVPFVEDDDWMHLPLHQYPDFADLQPYLNEILTHPLPDEFRERHNFRKSIRVPGFHATTWYDVFLPSVFAAYLESQARCGNQRLWVGPNSHYFIYANKFWPRDPYFEWFDYWLKDEPTALVKEPPVYFSTRPWVRKWRDYQPLDWVHAEHWPPSPSREQRLYLTDEGRLDDTPGQAGSLAYIYDPRQPIPTVGGRNMRISAGQQPQNAVREMPNYGLIYASVPLRESLTIAGPVTLHLTVESNCLDTDFVGKLIEKTDDGDSNLILDGVVRAMHRSGRREPLKCGRPCDLVMDLGHIYHRFSAGSQIQIDITSSNFPRRIRNTNSGHADVTKDDAGDIRLASNKVWHGQAASSYVLLPVIDRNGES